MTGSTGSTGSTGHGSFAEESARLLGAFQEWVAQGHQPPAEGSGRAGPECGICPICQGLSLLRGVRPEVLEHLSDAVTSLTAALAALLPQEAQAPARRRTERVQHIDVSGDDRADAAG